jgi:large subunit ribosomal protein L17
MRHNVDGRKFGMNTSHRLAMFRNMANSVIQKEQITTTLQKAKEARRIVDRLITLGKSGSPASRRLAFDRTRDQDVVKKLFTTLAERYKSRAGGYTRVLKLSQRRWGDAAEMAILELVDHAVIDRKRKVKKAEEGKEGEEKKAAETAPKDPLNRFRKMFSGKSKVQGQSGKGHSPVKGGGASRKTPAAGGGGSKTGGSS